MGVPLTKSLLHVRVIKPVLVLLDMLTTLVGAEEPLLGFTILVMGQPQITKFFKHVNFLDPRMASLVLCPIRVVTQTLATRLHMKEGLSKKSMTVV